MVKYLEQVGAYAVKIVVAGKAGTPDIFCCLRGKFIAIEGKTETGQLSKLQIEKLEQIENAGGITIVAYSYEDFLIKFKAVLLEFVH